jgi:hypothetical protein
VEKTTRKWLMIMNKDCNRFCKILVCIYLFLRLEFHVGFLESEVISFMAILNFKLQTLAKKNDVSAQQAPRKQRKITFADEAGGKLCHVKLFKVGSTSLSECQSDS